MLLLVFGWILNSEWSDDVMFIRICFIHLTFNKYFPGVSWFSYLYTPVPCTHPLLVHTLYLYTPFTCTHPLLVHTCYLYIPVPSIYLYLYTPVTCTHPWPFQWIIPNEWIQWLIPYGTQMTPIWHQITPRWLTNNSCAPRWSTYDPQLLFWDLTAEGFAASYNVALVVLFVWEISEKLLIKKL